MTLPVVASMAFFPIANIDSHSGTIIRVMPQNLMAAFQSMTKY
jgi:hypothetical protein